MLPTPFSKPDFTTAVLMKLVFCPSRTPPPPPLNFTALETFTLNPDPRTPLSDAEVKKTFHLRSLAENIPDGFYSGPPISRNPLPGLGNILSKLKALPGPISAL